MIQLLFPLLAFAATTAAPAKDPTTSALDELLADTQTKCVKGNGKCKTTPAGTAGALSSKQSKKLVVKEKSDEQFLEDLEMGREE